MAEVNQGIDSKITKLPIPTGPEPPTPQPTSVPGPKAQVQQFTPKELIHGSLEERKEIIGAVKNNLNNLMTSIQDLISIDERVMGIYHKELYPEEAAAAEKKYEEALAKAKARQQGETPK